MDRPELLTSEFKARGLKLTPQRQLLWRLLHENTTHPTAEGLYAQASALMPGISLRTVYHTLNDLVAMGELRAVSIGGGPTRFDPNTEAHHHSRCLRCGAVADVYVGDADGLDADGLDGFTVEGTQIVFTGTCADCAAAPDRPSPTPAPEHQGEQP
jgi:Fur family peroxide stress response transcriptional regulator